MYELVFYPGTANQHRIPFSVPNVDGGFVNPSILVLQADPTANGKAVEILGVYVQIAPAPAN